MSGCGLTRHAHLAGTGGEREPCAPGNSYIEPTGAAKSVQRMQPINSLMRS